MISNNYPGKTTLLLVCVAIAACQPDARAQQVPSVKRDPVIRSGATWTPEQPIQPESKRPRAATRQEEASQPSFDEIARRYAWVEGREEEIGALNTLERAFDVPTGFERVEVAPGSFQGYLRGLPVRTDRTRALTYRGEPAGMPSAAVIPLDLGTRDLHQCADSVIRLHAEYLWSQGRADQARYHYTSGDLDSWKEARRGARLRVRGDKVVRVKGAPAPDTHGAYRGWLDGVFMYASTRSLHRDAERVEAPAALRAGDFFLMGGSPGHVIVILDVATSPGGTRAALLGQGYLPAREFHVIRADADNARARDRVWHLLPSHDHETIETPTWRPFSMAHAWRFKAP